MHRSIRDHLEEVLAGSRDDGSRGLARGSEVAEHLKNCEECGGQVEAMREQALLLRHLRSEAEPRPGFYARVMERIEAEGPASIWNVFIESTFSRRVAMASMALALLFGVYVVTAEQNEHATITVDGNASNQVWNQPGTPDRDAILVNLVTYQEQ
jgi:predicted anti-sigma-YlaC factor YlaD